MRNILITIFILILISCSNTEKKESTVEKNIEKKSLTHRDSIIEIMKQVTIHHKWNNIYNNNNISGKIKHNQEFNFGADTEPAIDIYIGNKNDYEYFRVYGLEKKGNFYNFKTISLKTKIKTQISLNIVDSVNDLAVIKIDTNLVGYFIPKKTPECDIAFYNCKHEKNHGY